MGGSSFPCKTKPMSAFQKKKKNLHKTVFNSYCQTEPKQTQTNRNANICMYTSAFKKGEAQDECKTLD